jgi:hypothetical protein
MPATGTAEWKGDLRTGTGTFTAGDSISGGYTFKSRFEDGPGSNPVVRSKLIFRVLDFNCAVLRRNSL